MPRKKTVWSRRPRVVALVTLVCTVAVLSALVARRAAGQLPAVKFDVRSTRGLPVSPVYEGWYELGGKRYALFGYYNRNLEEVIDLPIGPQNQLSPGPQDQGQPTRFHPGLYYGVFATSLPDDRKTELTWTITANGQTLSIPTALDPLYVISPQRETGTEYPTNTPPIVKFDAAGASAQGPHGLVVSRSASTARPLTLDVWVTDDGLPPRREGRAPARRLASRRDQQGLALSWQMYRGAGATSFSNETPAIENGKASTTVTFREPGSYMLHLTAIDSRSANRCCWTNGYVEVKVEGQ